MNVLKKRRENEEGLLFCLEPLICADRYHDIDDSNPQIKDERENESMYGTLGFANFARDD
jgi:hypothetical protein